MYNIYATPMYVNWLPAKAETMGTLFISLRGADLNLTDRSLAIFQCSRPNWKPGKWRITYSQTLRTIKKSKRTDGGWLMYG